MQNTKFNIEIQDAKKSHGFILFVDESCVFHHLSSRSWFLGRKSSTGIEGLLIINANINAPVVFIYTGGVYSYKITAQYILHPVMTLFCRTMTSFLVPDWHTDHGALHDLIQYLHMYNGSMTTINKR